jgi:NAD(P)H-quinone oxidoreductase subunit 5
VLVAVTRTWPLVLSFAPAVVLAGTAATVGRRATPASTWRTARAATVVAAALSLGLGLARVAVGARASDFVRLDSVTVVMLVLVALVGWVVVRFSGNYLAGDPHEVRYARLMLATLASVSVVVVANNLVLLIAAWTATSLALHGLLVHFGERPVAVAVAHKKFLLARSADVCMVAGAVAFWSSFGTLRIDEIGDAARGEASLPFVAQLGIAFVAIAAVLKSAQLPFHGWLIQVMEAPTPVSALLHAGVVNLGGFVLLRFAPVVDRAVPTQTLLVVVGVSTAVLASLVMTTRVSVKVSLAWSTCAQMGFMLVQCGLGLWEMALLHLVAHSGYKAHAFLSAGGTVRRTQARRLAPPVRTVRVRDIGLGAGAAIVGTVAISLAWQALPGTAALSGSVWVMLGVVALALAPLVEPIGHGQVTPSMAGALAVPVAYLALHEAASRLVSHSAGTPTGLLVVTAAGFAGLFVMQSAYRVRPDARPLRRVRPWIYSGLFLDDAFTRAAFAVFPPPAAHAQPSPLPGTRSIAMVPTRRSAPDEPPAALRLDELVPSLSSRSDAP